MKVFVRILIVVLTFYIGISIGLAADELINGGPWYTYKNNSGQSVIMWQETQTVSDKQELPLSVEIAETLFYPSLSIVRGKDTAATLLGIGVLAVLLVIYVLACLLWKEPRQEEDGGEDIAALGQCPACGGEMPPGATICGLCGWKADLGT